MKNIQKSIRMSSDVFNFISQYRGKNFNDSLENLIYDFSEVLPGKQSELDVVNAKLIHNRELLRRLVIMRHELDVPEVKALIDDVNKAVGGVG